MRGKVARWIVLCTVLMLAVGILAAAVFMWRLSQGPIALTFLSESVEDALNANVSGVVIQIDDVVIEREGVSGSPQFRMRNVRIHDDRGEMIAQAPRAAVGVSGSRLLTGKVVPKQLELIGARILIRRSLQGDFQLGFGTPSQAQEQPARRAASGKAGRADVAAEAQDTGAEPQDGDDRITPSRLLEFVNRQLNRTSSPLHQIEAVLVSEASISLYDEANDAVWFAPKANLVLRKVAYGFALFADTSIASGVEPWRAELVATFRRNSRTFSVSARIFDLVPADIADEVFALSQFAQVKLPLSGHAEVEFTDDGRMTRARAELTAAAGKVGLPNYISEPILIDEGLLKVAYDPGSGAFLLNESAIFIGGNQAKLQGRVEPKYSPQGRLSGLGFELSARNVRIDATGDPRNPLPLDRIDIEGLAAIDAARLDIHDLVLMKGEAGIRMRGRFTGEDGAVGIYMGGRVRDLPSEMVMKLWPPIVVPGARNWLQEHLLNARIPDGTFQLALPGKVLSAALRDKEPIPDERVSARFRLAEVDTLYFQQLPALTGMSGQVEVRGNHLEMTLNGGTVTLPSGETLEMSGGTLNSHDLAKPVSPMTIDVVGSGKAQAFLELIDQQPLGLITEAGFDPQGLSGEVRVRARFDLAAQQNMTREDVKISAAASLSDAAYEGAYEGFDITRAAMQLRFSEDRISASGPARLNGIPVKLNWERDIDPSGQDAGDDTVTIEARLDDEERAKLGADLSHIMRGPMHVTARSQLRNGKIVRTRVEADLSSASMRFDPISWSRPATRGTKASFDVIDLGNERTRISNMAIEGKDLKIVGSVLLGSDRAFLEGTFPTMVLGPRNQFAVGLKNVGGKLKIAATGKSFDAKPLIGSVFARAEPAAASAFPKSIDVSIDKVYANRGEMINDVRGRLEVDGDVVKEADLQGTFAGGAPVTYRITPTSDGARSLRIASRDSGAALRAANLYSKVSGGLLDFHARLGSGGRDTIQRGLLTIRNFAVQDEAALKDIEKKSAAQAKARKTVVRRGNSLRFSKLTVPFSVDQNFVRIGDALVQGPELGASAQGMIRKGDGRMDIGGTIIPAYALNAAISEFPLFGQIIAGGKGQGLFGLNFAIQGTINDPRFVINPVSALAPGFLRRIFDIGGGGVASDGTPAKPPSRRRVSRDR